MNTCEAKSDMRLFEGLCSLFTATPVTSHINLSEHPFSELARNMP